VLREPIVAGMQMILGACLTALAVTGCVTQIQRVPSIWNRATDPDCTTRYEFAVPPAGFCASSRVRLHARPMWRNHVDHRERGARDSPRSIPG
jgi:hypothetical protein